MYTHSILSIHKLVYCTGASYYTQLHSKGEQHTQGAFNMLRIIVSTLNYKSAIVCKLCCLS